MTNKATVCAAISANSINHLSVTEHTCELGVVCDNTGNMPGNTNVRLTLLSAEGVAVAQVAAFYNRMSLEEMVNGGSLTFVSVGVLTSADLLAAFNERFNSDLDTDDIVVENLPPTGGIATRYTLQAVPSSYGITGSIEVLSVPPAAN